MVLVNAWDVASARIVVATGAPAVATTSAGVAWSLGRPDGDALDRDLAVAMIRRMAAAVEVPVTADIESGFGATPADVAVTVRAVAEAGAAGINIEDGTRDIREHADRLAAIRELPVFVNARIDTYLRGSGDIADAIRRAHAFLDAGADGVFLPGVSDATSIATLVAEIPAPLNILVGPGSLTVGALADLGVARISLGSSVAQAAYAVAEHAAHEAYRTGTYEAVAGGLDYTALNTLLGRA